MKRSRFKRAVRLVAVGALLGVTGAALGPSNEADASGVALELSFGDSSKGFLTHPIYRGGGVPFDFMLLATPGNCQKHLQVSIAWDEDENWVRVRVQGDGALERLPTVDRTEGVNFFPNPFSPEPEDFENGRYLLWIVTSPGTAKVYYDAVTLDLIGSEFDHDTQPPQSIAIEIPYFAAIPSEFIQPDANGDVDAVYEYAYDGLVRPDLPQFAHTVGFFIPHSLCHADPYRYDRNHVKQYLTHTDSSRALTWREFLENGLVYDMTVEPPEYFTNPPLATNVGVYQGAVGISGNIPKGWMLDFSAIFGGIAPPIIPLPTAPYPGESCENWYRPAQQPSIDLCAGPPPGGGGPGGAP